MGKLGMVQHHFGHVFERLRARLLGAERAPEAQLAQDVEDQVVDGLGDVLRLHPPRRLLAVLRATVQQDLDPPIHVRYDVLLGRAHRLVRKGRVQDAALARVRGLVDAVPRVNLVDAPRVDRVVGTLLGVGLGIVDVAVRLRRVEEHAVGAEAEGVAVDLVALPDPDVPRAAQRVVERRPAGELGEEGTGIPCERVEVDAVEGAEDILRSSQLECLDEDHGEHT